MFVWNTKYYHFTRTQHSCQAITLKIASNKICYHKRWQNVLKSSFFITGFEVYIHTPPVQNSPTALLTLSSPPFPKQYPLPGDSYNDKQNQASIRNMHNVWYYLYSGAIVLLTLGNKQIKNHHHINTPRIFTNTCSNLNFTAYEQLHVVAGLVF